ncbi:urease accessory protein UreE [Natronorubrum bangense]|uniref:Urease accessory protein UreE n=2 Tax=Natronorubrum bangense TaxID=61858 RepID=L9WAH9_9EURY|nr:urease accessory protein UreE [Natronorubrum bangense]ELY46377.1 urease accessory protein UreE [Natronorubrum bangense JCM 10635]QCC56579.1 urease accessory protein UreE [Natronorubrum bangense]
MKRIDSIVGNVHADDDLAALRTDHEAAGTLERVVIDADNRRRSRFRATTDSGTDVGVTVDKAAVSAGDVLLVDADRMIVVAFEPRDALAVTLPTDTTTQTLEAAVELGHRIGNQHWDLAVEKGVVYVPLAADRHIVERVVADIVPCSTIQETTVEADLFVTDPDDAGTDHKHGRGDEQTGGDHSHEHPHDGHSHGHMHSDHSHDHHHDN